MFTSMLRRVLPLLVGFVCCANSSVSRAAEVEIVRVWPGWHNADYFERIGEYFGRGENTGRETVLRTQAADRAGYYFLVRVKNTTALAGAKLAVSVVRPDMP